MTTASKKDKMQGSIKRKRIRKEKEKVEAKEGRKEWREEKKVGRR